MENCRTSVLFLFLAFFFVAFSVTTCAETVEEKKAAANYDETLPAPGEAQAVEKASSEPQVFAGMEPAQAIIPPVQGIPPAATKAERSPTPGTVRPSPAATPSVARDMPQTQVFTTPNPSGLVEVSGYKYPVFFFAPKDYKVDRTYPMIMIAPAENAKAEEQIEYLTGLAQRKGIFLLAPYVFWPKAGDTPYRLDEWFLTVKKDMMERFPIDKKRVYLVGKDMGAHYAAYVAIKYPKEFTAAALLGQAWDGPFSQLIRPRTNAANQIPFYIALKTDGEIRSRNQVWFDELQKKGYPLHLVDYPRDENLNDLEFKKSVFDWMESTGQSWEASVAQGQKTWKGKFKKGVRDFFTV